MRMAINVYESILYELNINNQLTSDDKVRRATRNVEYISLLSFSCSSFSKLVTLESYSKSQVEVQH